MLGIILIILKFLLLALIFSEILNISILTNFKGTFFVVNLDLLILIFGMILISTNYILIRLNEFNSEMSKITRQIAYQNFENSNLFNSKT